MTTAIWVFLAAVTAQTVPVDGPEWERHIVDNGSKGADGVKLDDVDLDGDLDLVCGWEEGGVIRVYLNPGTDAVRDLWPFVEVGQIKSPEDAILADLDGDGGMDVVSFAEGKARAIHVHWGPRDGALRLNPNAWKTELLPWPEPAQLWMQGVAMDLDGKNGLDLVTASKGSGATVSLALSPKRARDLGAWTTQVLRKSHWIMSVVPKDMDGDGLSDLLIVDRKGDRSGVFWLKNPGAEKVLLRKKWREFAVGAPGREVMFLDAGDVNADGHLDVVAAVKPREVHLFLGGDEVNEWQEEVVQLGGEIGDAKGVALGDLNADGLLDIVFTCEHADGPLSGIVWLEQREAGAWNQRPLGGAAGLKYDYPVTIDLDGDGDLDVLTCEERDQLGIIWYENPHH